MNLKHRRHRHGWLRAVALVLLIIMAPACMMNPAQIYIPLAYGLTGLCVALLISPTYVAALVGLVAGGLIGAMVYNNSLKRQLLEGQQRAPAAGK